MDPERDALRIALYYALFSILWILSSDYLVALMFQPPVMVRLSVLKGSLFIILTSLLLYFLLRLYLRSLTDKERALRISEHKFRSLFMELPVGVVLMDTSGRILESNPAMGRFHDDSLDGMLIGDIHPDLEPAPDREFMVRMEGRWLRVLITRIEGGFLGIFEDLTDIKNSEEAARRSLEANRTLLAELHHRVKNNLQVISSLINIQSSKMGREHAEIMRSLQLRIKSIAVIHEMLLSSPESSSISFASYVSGLTGYLRDMYQSAAEFDLDVSDVEFNIETAVPLGLIVGELVSNSLRHAFTDGGTIRISLEGRDDGFILVVADNGRGLPDNFSLQESAGIGLELVKNLVRQLEGSIDCHSNEWTTFTVEFRELKYPERLEGMV